MANNLKLLSSLFVLLMLMSISQQIQQKSSLNSKLLNKLTKSRFGKTILALEQLASLSGSNGSSVDLLFETLQELSDELKAQRLNENNDFLTAQGIFESSQSTKNQLETAWFEAQTYETDQLNNNYIPTYHDATFQVSQNEDIISSSKASIESLTAFRQQESDRNNLIMSNNDAGIEAISQALYLLDSLVAQANAANPTTLLQTDQKSKLAKVSADFKRTMAKVHSPMLYSSIAQALLDLSNGKEFANQDMLANIISMLQNLSDSMDHDNQMISAYEAQAISDFNTSIDGLQATIVNSQSIVDAETLVANDNATLIDNANAAITDLQNKRNQNAIDLQALQDAWAISLSVHNNLMDELCFEITTVFDAYNALVTPLNYSGEFFVTGYAC